MKIKSSFKQVTGIVATSLSLTALAIFSEPASTEVKVTVNPSCNSRHGANIGLENSNSPIMKYLLFQTRLLHPSENSVELCQQISNRLENFYNGNAQGVVSFKMSDNGQSLCMGIASHEEVEPIECNLGHFQVSSEFEFGKFLLEKKPQEAFFSIRRELPPGRFFALLW